MEVNGFWVMLLTSQWHLVMYTGRGWYFDDNVEVEGGWSIAPEPSAPRHVCGSMITWRSKEVGR